MSFVGLTRLSITADNRVFYGSEDARFSALSEFESEFRSNTKMLLVVVCDLPLADCDVAPSLIRNAAKGLLDVEGVVRVDSIANQPFIKSTADDLVVSTYLAESCPDTCSNTSVLLDDRMIGRFVSQDLTSFAVIATLDFDVGAPGEVQRIHRETTELVESLKEKYSVDVRFVGTIPLMQAFLDAANRDIGGILAAAISLTFVILVIAYSNLFVAGALSMLGLSTMVITLGAAGWFGLVLNTATATIPLILFTIVVATSTHLYMHVVRARGENSRLSVSEAVDAALGAQLVPICLTGITTIVCLGSLAFVTSPPIQEIGIWTSVGIATGTAILLLIVPLTLSYSNSISGSKWQEYLQRKLNLLARSMEKERPTSVLLILLVALSGLSIVSLEIDDDFVRYFDTENSFRKDTEFVSEKLFGPNNVEVVVGSTKEQGIDDPQFVAVVDQLAKYLRQHPSVKNVISIADVVEEMHVHLGDGSDVESLTSEAVAQYLLAHEMSLEHGQDAGDLVGVGRNKARVSVVSGDITSSQVRELEQDIYDWAERFSGSYTVEVTGESIPISHLTSENIRAVVTSILLSFVITSIALGLLFGSWQIGLVALVTTVVPVVCGFGIWGLFVDSVGLSTTVIIAVCMGVVIDDAIHIIYRFVDARERLDFDAVEAGAYAVHRVGTSIVTSSIALVAGFAVLYFSDFALNSTFGACSALIIVCALVMDLFMLPKMLGWAARKQAA